MPREVHSLANRPRLRPLRWWLPEFLNRIRAPEGWLRDQRRQEVAETLRDAKRRGIVVDPSLRATIVARAPRKQLPALPLAT